MKSLDNLQIGESVKVVAVHGGHTALRRRLLDMGLTPDTNLCITRVAPMGDPIEVSLRDYSLTIRKSDAKLIEVE